MKPKVICHMVTSLDGRVTGEFLRQEKAAPAIARYYEIHRAFAADGFACGRVTMAESFAGDAAPDLVAYTGVAVPEGDFVADPAARFFAISFDTRGRLAWRAGHITDEDEVYDGAHVIAVVSAAAPAAYLAYCRAKGISYIVAGKERIDPAVALEKLFARFGIRRLLLEGGSDINGAFAAKDLIDSISLVVAPVSGATADKPLFAKAACRGFALKSATTEKDGVLWLQYERE